MVVKYVPLVSIVVPALLLMSFLVEILQPEILTLIACAARVMVIGLCCVCVSVTMLAATALFADPAKVS